MATVNNNWPTPVQTDLVKDGWEAIKDLGDAIDTTLGVYADPGLVLLNTTSFSAVASQSVNDVFSATYDNYKIIVTNTICSPTNFRLRALAQINLVSLFIAGQHNYSSVVDKLEIGSN
jgi:4-hydroxy-3-methylbut-2-enyl diphosphate reductase IspH